MDFPTLYKLAGSGNQKWNVWTLWVEEVSPELCYIKRRYGQEHGKMTETMKEITSGKNKGKRNETTVFEQACMDAKSLFQKQKDTHKYSENKSTTETVTVPSPMLAHSFDKQSAKIVFPCLVQPKLDGVRMLCHVSLANNTVECYSRTGKAFDSVPLQNITRDLMHIVQKHKNMTDFFWDGELFSTELMFEDIVGACRTSVTHDSEKYKHLEYHVYDLLPNPNQSMQYTDRYNLLESVLSSKNTSFVRLVECKSVDNKEDIFDMHDRYISQGYEGVMIRNKKGVYKSSRSYDLQKYKHFVDHEYTIVDVKEAVGSDMGTAIIQCKMENGNSFWVRPKGSREYRTRLLQDQDRLIGKPLTVRYQNLTDKGIPRFPVGITIRDYE